jgi:hypothetical protein
MLCLRETTSGISSCMVDAAQASHVPARQRTDQVAQHRRQPKHVSLHISQQGIPAPTPTANSPLHVPPDSQLQSSLVVCFRPNHGANTVPPWYRQEDREGAFEPADEQECRYTGTSDGYRGTEEGRKAMQEHKINMQHRSTLIMRCLCKSTYRPPDIIPPRDGDTTCIPYDTIRNVIDSEAAER